MPQRTRGFVQREMPMQDDGEIVGDQATSVESPDPILSYYSASGSFLEENPDEVSTERPICGRCGSSSCVCE